MSTIGQIERLTQNRVVKLFREQLGYDYLGNWEDRPGNNNIEEAYLRPFLQQQGYDETIIKRALYELSKVAGDQTKASTILTRPSMACCVMASRSNPILAKTPSPSS